MSPTARRRLRVTGIVAGVLLAGSAGLGGWFYGRLRASLPQLDGNARLPGLAAPVTVTRDALGVPTLRGANRNDLARALGYVHAQDRFFQMDTLRRRAAGELAELFGQYGVVGEWAARAAIGFRHFGAEKADVAGLVPQCAIHLMVLDVFFRVRHRLTLEKFHHAIFIDAQILRLPRRIFHLQRRSHYSAAGITE